MAAITVTAASVAPNYSTECQIRSRTAAVAITAGQAVYYNSSGKAALTDANGATAALWQFAGIALDTVAADEVTRVLEEGWLAGYTLSGVAYGGNVYLSDTPGGLDTAASTTGNGIVIGQCDWRNDAGGTFTKFLRVNRRPAITGNAEVKSVRVALTGAGIAAGTIAWVNPEVGYISINRVLLQISTASTGASTIDVGTTATSAVTSSDNLIDGVSGATAGVFDNLNDAGTNGKSRQRLATGKWVTINDTTGDATGLVGSLIIEYVVE